MRAYSSSSGFVALEVAVRSRAAGVDDALGNPLVVEMRDLLAQDEVFEQRRPAQTGLEGVLVVTDRHSLIGGQRLLGGFDADPIERPDGLVAHRWGEIHYRPFPIRSSR